MSLLAIIHAIAVSVLSLKVFVYLCIYIYYITYVDIVAAALVDVVAVVAVAVVVAVVVEVVLAVVVSAIVAILAAVVVLTMFDAMAWHCSSQGSDGSSDTIIVHSHSSRSGRMFLT